MDHRLATTLAAAYEAFHASAGSHKRASDFHKREAKKAHKAADLVKQEAERLGIHLEITQTPGGSHSGTASRPQHP